MNNNIPMQPLQSSSASTTYNDINNILLFKKNRGKPQLPTDMMAMNMNPLQFIEKIKKDEQDKLQQKQDKIITLWAPVDDKVENNSLANSTNNTISNNSIITTQNLFKSRQKPSKSEIDEQISRLGKADFYQSDFASKQRQILIDEGKLEVFKNIKSFQNKLNASDADIMEELQLNLSKKGTKLSDEQVYMQDVFKMKKNKLIQEGNPFQETHKNQKNKELKQTTLDNFFNTDSLNKQNEDAKNNAIIKENKLYFEDIEKKKSQFKFINQRLQQQLKQQGKHLSEAQIKELLQRKLLEANVKQDRNFTANNKQHQSVIQRQKQLKAYRDSMLGDNNTQSRLALLQKDLNGLNNNQNGNLLNQQDTDIINMQMLEQRKDFKALLKFLMSHDFAAENTHLSKEDKRIPISFPSAFQYTTIFSYLFLKEACSQIKQSIDQIRKKGLMSTAKKYRVRVNHASQTFDAFTYLDIKPHEALVDPNDPNSDALPQHSSYRKPIDNVDAFDLNLISNNYLVFVSSLNRLDLSLLNESHCFLQDDQNYNVSDSGEKRLNKNKNKDIQDDERKHFLLIGFIQSKKEKGDVFEDLKIKIYINADGFKQTYGRPNTDWLSAYIYPIDKMSTQIREYISLLNIEYQPISKILYEPAKVLNKNKPVQERGVLEPFFAQIKSEYNTSQFDAIKAICAIQDGVSLLQGPPGTGKTHTLLGILSGLYHYMRNSKFVYKKVLLVCAPSNAAIDEIIFRLVTQGLTDQAGMPVKARVVRIGVIDKDTSEDVRRVSIEHLIQEEIIAQTKFQQLASATKGDAITCKEVHVEISRIKSKLDEFAEMKGGDSSNVIENDMKESKTILLDKLRALQNNYTRIKNDKLYMKEKYADIMKRILSNAEIVCCTLGSAGSEKLEFFRDDIYSVIIDEASQCTEVSNIVPLQWGIDRMVLIGDPSQLPATTFSPDANTTLYNRSLFERFLQNGHKPYFLDTQYRMCENIRAFPSMSFYQNRLKDAASITTRKVPKFLSTFRFPNNFFFLDLPFSREKNVEKSFMNETEAQAGMLICKKLLKRIGSISEELQISRQTSNKSSSSAVQIQEQLGSIGFITPYKKQMRHFQDIVRQRVSKQMQNYLQVNTIDSFQGQEKDVVIFSTVRAMSNKAALQQFENNTTNGNAIGFLQDQRRMNVALTRAKHVMFVLGNSCTLATNPLWASWVQWVYEEGHYIKAQNWNQMKGIISNIFKGKQLNDSFLEVEPQTGQILQTYADLLKKNEICDDSSISNHEEGQNGKEIINTSDDENKQASNQLKKGKASLVKRMNSMASNNSQHQKMRRQEMGIQDVMAMDTLLEINDQEAANFDRNINNSTDAVLSEDNFNQVLNEEEEGMSSVEEGQIFLNPQNGAKPSKKTIKNQTSEYMIKKKDPLQKTIKLKQEEKINDKTQQAQVQSEKQQEIITLVKEQSQDSNDAFKTRLQNKLLNNSEQSNNSVDQYQIKKKLKQNAENEHDKAKASTGIQTQKFNLFDIVDSYQQVQSNSNKRKQL